MLIGAYGMFWQRHEVNWAPRSGSRWDMLGVRGGNVTTRQVVDFRRAKGVYVLFDDHGAYYVGIARGQAGLGGRLKDHTQDEHSYYWSRFCWLSFDEVTNRTDDQGLLLLKERPNPRPASNKELIEEIEALLITLMNTRNISTMRFKRAERWAQVTRADRQALLEKL